MSEPMVPCEQCDQFIAIGAESCPHCGRLTSSDRWSDPQPLPPPVAPMYGSAVFRLQRALPIFVVVAVILLAIAVVVLYLS